MKVLLDTHAFLWWIIDSPLIPLQVRNIISDSDNELFLSAASCWEIAIKAKIGRIKLPNKPRIFVPEQMALNAILAVTGTKRYMRGASSCSIHT